MASLTEVGTGMNIGKFSRLLTVIALATSLLGAGAGPSSAISCETNWGSTPKSSQKFSSAFLSNIRTGRHACFDRLVIDSFLAHQEHPLAYHVHYVPYIIQDGSGNPKRMRGGAILEVRISSPSYSPETGEVTYQGKPGCSLPGVDIRRYRTFRDVCFIGSFEGDSQIGLGLRGRLPFRSFQLGDRLVVDVAHTW